MIVVYSAYDPPPPSPGGPRAPGRVARAERPSAAAHRPSPGRRRDSPPLRDIRPRDLEIDPHTPLPRATRGGRDRAAHRRDRAAELAATRGSREPVSGPLGRRARIRPGAGVAGTGPRRSLRATPARALSLCSAARRRTPGPRGPGPRAGSARAADRGLG